MRAVVVVVVVEIDPVAAVVAVETVDYLPAENAGSIADAVGVEIDHSDYASYVVVAVVVDAVAAV